LPIDSLPWPIRTSTIRGASGWLAAWSVASRYLAGFFDFSGYTDIARGCAKLLGFEFPLNFARPLLAGTRLTLAKVAYHPFHWVRDYVFMPLVRGQKGRLCLYRNMFVVMVLVGLWHGANWTFVAWAPITAFVIGYRLFDRGNSRNADRQVMKKRWFVAVQRRSYVCSFVYYASFFRPKTLQTALTS
jgi:D-alanyl-lipoteichoic acid acyltransferase DltB (MBOAT superfamily)